jgi:hypothetical protein
MSMDAVLLTAPVEFHAKPEVDEIFKQGHGLRFG